MNAVKTYTYRFTQAPPELEGTTFTAEAGNSTREALRLLREHGYLAETRAGLRGSAYSAEKVARRIMYVYYKGAAKLHADNTVQCLFESCRPA